MKNELLDFFNLIKLKGDLEFLGPCEIMFDMPKIYASYCYKNIIKVWAEVQYGSKKIGKFYPTDIKELIKAYKSFKKEPELKIENNNLILKSENQEIVLNGISENLNIYKPIKWDDLDVEFCELKKAQLKEITDLSLLIDNDYYLIESISKGIEVSAKNNHEVTKKIILDKSPESDIIVSVDFINLLKMINDDCKFGIKDNKIQLHYNKNNLKFKCILMGLENENV